MKDVLEVETALRLIGERRLVAADDRGGWAPGLGDIASALVLLCNLPEDVAESVVDDYGFAQSLRGHGPPPRFRAHRRAALRQSPQPTSLAAPIVVTCDRTVELPHGVAHLGCAVFTDDSCQISVRYDGAPSWVAGRPRRMRRRATPTPAWGPPQLVLTDDQGTQATAHFSGGGSDETGWHGRWTTHDALSSATRWLDLDGVRVELGEVATPCETRVESLPDEPVVHRFLWQRLASSDEWPIDDTLVRALIELEVIERDDPVLGQIADVGEALSTFRGATAPSSAPPQWQGLFARRHREDGPTGDVLLTAATPEFDGTVAVVYDMRSEPHGFNMQARVVGDCAVSGGPFDDTASGVALAWWAQDDVGNTYRGRWGNHGNGLHDINGELGFHPALDPAARRLSIMPTGLSQRAVIEVPLPDWGDDA